MFLLFELIVILLINKSLKIKNNKLFILMDAQLFHLHGWFFHLHGSL